MSDSIAELSKLRAETDDKLLREPNASSLGSTPVHLSCVSLILWMAPVARRGCHADTAAPSQGISVSVSVKPRHDGPENHAAMVAAMEPGIANHVWSV